MDPKETSQIQRIFAHNLRRLRTERGLSQEALAHEANIDKSHVGYFEQFRNSPTLETIEKVAKGLRVPIAELFAPVADEDEEDTELARLNALLPYVRRYQELAEEYEINDIFQDNGGKLLQTLIVTGLKNMPGREGNDAIDNDGGEWELKTVNRNLTKSFSTHHHLTVDILAKYREAKWLFCVYEGIELIEIWQVPAANLEPLFQKWEEQLEVAQEKIIGNGLAHKNNPKVPLNFVKEHGELFFREAPDDRIRSTRKLAYFPKKERVPTKPVAQQSSLKF